MRIYVEIDCLKRAVLLQGCLEYLSLKQLGQGSLEIRPEAGASWELGVINLNVQFFSSGERILCFA